VSVEVAIVQHLSDDAGVTALIAGRVYQLKLPQGATLPAVRVQLIDEPSEYHLRGERSLTRARVQTDAYAGGEDFSGDPYAQAVAVADAVHAAMSGDIFSVGSPIDVEVTGVFRAMRRVLYEAEELRQVRVMQDYIVWSRHVA
jgi:hypothetical protein